MVQVPILILYGGVDITQYVEIEGCEFTSAVNGRVGTCKLPIRDLGHAFDFDPGKELTVDLDNKRLWGGFGLRIARRYYFNTTIGSAALTPRQFVIEGFDYNILLSKRYLHNAGTGNPGADETIGQLTTYPANTSDRDIIIQYLADHTDLTADGINCVVMVDTVGTPATDAEIAGHSGWSIADFLRFISRDIGSIWYIDPDKRLVYCDVDTPTAPFDISDNPSGSEVGGRDMEIDFDGGKLENDAFIWGAGQGDDQVVFSRVSDAPSLGEHGRWQGGEFTRSVWRQETADRMANTRVYGSPQSKRGGKDDRPSVRTTLFSSGLRVADKATVISATYGYSDVLPVREMRLSFPSKVAKFELVLSHEIDIPWSTFEFWFPDLTLPELDTPEIPDFFPPFDPCACIETELGEEDCTTVGEVMGVFGAGGCSDDFERVESDDWGSPDEYLLCRPWNASVNGLHFITSGVATQQADAGGQVPTDWVYYDEWDGDVVEFVAKVRLPMPNRTRTFFIFQSDGVNNDGPGVLTNGGIQFRWSMTYDAPSGNSTIGVFARRGPAHTYSAQQTITRSTTTPWFWVRCFLEQGAIRIKMWEDGSSEPGPYQVSVADGSGEGFLNWLVNGNPQFPATGSDLPCDVFLARQLFNAGSGGTYEIDSIEFISGAACACSPCEDPEAAVEAVDKPRGATCESPTNLSTYVWRTRGSWTPGSMRVWFDGYLITPDRYVEDSGNRTLTFDTDFIDALPGGNYVWVCYDGNPILIAHV